jgi:hypothetical protein
MNQTSLHYRLSRRIRSLPAQIASRAINMPTIERRLTEIYEQARMCYRSKLPELSDADAAIVAALEEKGVCITSLEALGLPDVETMWEPASQLAAHYQMRSARGDFADKYTVQVSAEELMQNPGIVRWPLTDRILNIVETYLGLPASYDTLNFFYTVADGRQVAARKWHRDVEDRRMVKVIVYLHDVDIDTGPLEILHRPFPGSDTLEGANFPVLTQEMLEDRLGGPLDEADTTACTGRKGTVIFADVASHYHRGRPATGRDRCALFYNFFSRTPLRPFYCQRYVFSCAQLSELAKDLPARARDCMLWRPSLPWIAKLVPKAPL